MAASLRRRKAEEIIAKGRGDGRRGGGDGPGAGRWRGDDVRVDGSSGGGRGARGLGGQQAGGGGLDRAGAGRAAGGGRAGRLEARLYPVGRLDADSTGLLLLTNDGELANRLTHPRYEVPKTYRVRLRNAIADRDLGRLRSGVELEDGPTAPAQVRRLGEREIEIVLREGRNRQVRRMVEAVGNEVAALRRGRLRPARARRPRPRDRPAGSPPGKLLNCEKPLDKGRLTLLLSWVGG